MTVPRTPETASTDVMTTSSPCQAREDGQHEPGRSVRLWDIDSGPAGIAHLCLDCGLCVAWTTPGSV